MFFATEMKLLLTLCLLLSLVSYSEADSVLKKSVETCCEADSTTTPDEIPGLIAFWDFQEAAGTDRVSKGTQQYTLEEMNGPIKTSDDGVFGPRSADLEWGQWFRIKRADAPGLDLHGKGQPLTMVVWVQRESDRVWQYVAGMWSEGDARFKGETKGTGARAPARQYAMFINGYWQNDYTTYERSRAENQPMGYVSPYGGATPEHPFAFDYATGGTKLEKNRWYMLTFTYDGEWLKVYVDDQLDANGNYNPFFYDGPIFDGGEQGSDFTVAQRNHPKWPSYPQGVIDNDEGFDGKIGGLAVYDRALTDDEIEKLYQSTMNQKSK